MAKKPRRDRNSYPVLKKEITVCLIVFGGLLAVAGVVDLLWLNSGPIRFPGLDVDFTLGVPSLLLAACLVIFGFGFSASRKIIFATLGAVVCLVGAVLYFLFLFDQPEWYPELPISAVLAGMAAMLWVRSRELINAEIRAEGEERLKRQWKDQSAVERLTKR